MESLFTGAFELKEASGDRVFGLIGVAGPVDEPGHATICLKLESVKVMLDDDSLTLEMAEERALELARKIEMVVIRLQHLRALVKQGAELPAGMIFRGESDTEVI